jgi:hypothetical protein
MNLALTHWFGPAVPHNSSPPEPTETVVPCRASCQPGVPAYVTSFMYSTLYVTKQLLLVLLVVFYLLLQGSCSVHCAQCLESICSTL